MRIMKPFVCEGDKTSHGGVVLEGFDGFSVRGRRVAGVRHKVSCPQCKGEFPIAEGSSQVTYMGVAAAFGGMKTECGAVLLAGQHDHGIVAQGSGAVASQGQERLEEVDVAERAARERMVAGALNNLEGTRTRMPMDLSTIKSIRPT
jgi:uncharacterized Zn-binding protein involved in type VI secretion